jgi:hypothetical protein
LPTSGASSGTSSIPDILGTVGGGGGSSSEDGQ